jgi:hypothetical protein
MSQDGQLSLEEAAKLRSRGANLFQLSTQRNHHETHTSPGSVASVFVIGSALAQQAIPMPGMDMKGMDMKMMMPSPNDPPSTKDYKSVLANLKPRVIHRRRPPAREESLPEHF